MRSLEGHAYAVYQARFEWVEKEYFEGLRAEGGEISADSAYSYKKMTYENFKKTLDAYEEMKGEE